MKILKKIKSLMTYEEVRPLIYDSSLQKAYSSTSVAGGTLKGKTVVVTGGTSGIGYATAQRFLSEGCNVIITGRNIDKLKESLMSLKHDETTSLDYIVIDQLNPQMVNDGVSLAFSKAKIDVWVNCAGIFTKSDRKRQFRGIDSRTYFEVVNTNLRSTVLASKRVAEKMIEDNINGIIINVASICGYSNHFGHTPYGISKTGVIEYTKLLSKKYQGNVNIVGIAPGSVATRMGDKGFGKSLSGGNSVTKHTAMPEEIASVICFLSSSTGRLLNGQTVIASAMEIV